MHDLRVVVSGTLPEDYISIPVINKVKQMIHGPQKNRFQIEETQPVSW